MKKYFELVTIPIAIALLVAYNALAELLNVMLFTWEKVSKVFFARMQPLISTTAGFWTITQQASEHSSLCRMFVTMWSMETAGPVF